MFIDLYRQLADIRTAVSVMSTSRFRDLYQHLVDIRTSVFVFVYVQICIISTRPDILTYICVCDEHLYVQICICTWLIFVDSIMSTYMFRSVSAPF
jgi:hypothetical protein